MSITACTKFSPDAEFLAHCGNDGKIRIWDSQSGRLKQEYISNQHLASPCSALEWIWQTNFSPSPWKKRRRKQEDSVLSLAIGSSNGSLTIFNPSTSTSNTFEGHSSTVTALSFSPNFGLVTAGEDKTFIHWNLENGESRARWKSGKFKVTALIIAKDGKWMFSGCRTVKWWNLETKKVIKTFSASQGAFSCLEVIRFSEDSEFIVGGATGENCLSVWNLDESNQQQTPIATLVLDDDATMISTLQNPEATEPPRILCLTRSGQTQFFDFQLNGRSRPLKPSLTLTIANEQAADGLVPQIPILQAKFVENEKVILAHGEWINPVFERVKLDFGEKVQCLVRKDERKRDKKEEVAKVKGIIDDTVAYINAGSVQTPLKRNRTSSGSQIPLKERLENLSITTETNSTGKTASKANLAQLLIQGLNSKDRSILNDVLFTKNETVIKNTIARLPVQAIIPLLRELTTLLQGKTFASKVAVIWLEALLSTHSAHFLSLPDASEAFGPILSLIDSKLSLFADVCKLRGRLALVTGQIAQATEESEDFQDEGVLVYQDPDSSEEDAAVQEDETDTESDETWEEMSEEEQEVENEENEDSM